MKKILLSALLFLPLSGIAQMINTPATRQEKELIGNVTALTERSYDVFNGDVRQQRIATTNTYKFDTSGKATVVTQQYGGAQIRYEYSYNEHEKPLQVKVFREWSRGEPEYTNFFQYDDNGKLLRYYSLWIDEQVPVQTYIFSRWDNNNNATEGLMTTKKDTVNVYQEFDKANRRTLLRMLTKGNETAQMQLTMRYDREGRVVERTMAEGTLQPDVLRYKYDKKGFCTAMNNQKFEYLLDKKGNWIRRTAYINKQIIGITEREITYND